MANKKGGFTTIELLVTLFVAAIFLIASYQLYTVIIRSEGQARAQSVAQNLVSDYGSRYAAAAPYPCAASQPLNDAPITADGLVNVKITVTISCPKNSPNNVANVAVLLKYGSPQVEISYSTWAYVQDVCGNGWILVPGNANLGTSNFCVMKYEAKNVNGTAASQATGLPWVNITQNDAVRASAAACSTCHLVSEAEWMTLAANVLSVPSNWSGGAVGSGLIYRGHSDNDPAAALAASTNDSNGYYGTNNTGDDERRTLSLTNGEVVWDIAGNVWEWTNATIAPGQLPGLSAGTGWANFEWTDPGLLMNGLPKSSQPSSISAATGTWNSTKGIGMLSSYYGWTSSTEGYLRGGSYPNGGGYSGVLALAFSYAPNLSMDRSGFRVAKSINSQPEQLPQPTSCPTGFIPVPGDARLGTAGFCVMKYEAKNDGNNNAVSVASGTPWVNISLADALSKSMAACSGCHLITEAEWMTLAANVLSVPSNWSGGSVGYGYLYSGNNDGDPANAVTADTNDANGYYGTNNYSTDSSVTGGMIGKSQRRTLTLTNGEVIWDLAGNVWERTNAIIAGGAQPGASNDTGYISREWNDGSVLYNNYPPTSRPSIISTQVASWHTNQGVGQIYSYYGETDAHAFMRGGRFGWGTSTGVFALALNYPPTSYTASMGFRVSK